MKIITKKDPEHALCKIVYPHQQRLLAFGYSWYEFLDWAFDAAPGDSIISARPRWNEKHGDLFTIQGYEKVGNSIARMVERFMKYKGKGRVEHAKEG